MKKSPSVAEIDAKQVSNYDYAAKRFVGTKVEILGCNSLRKLKQGVKDRGWSMAWITAEHGCLSYGQNLVDEYPYIPRY